MHPNYALLTLMATVCSIAIATGVTFAVKTYLERRTNSGK